MPARLISHYRIVRRLGVGGMSEVLLAHDTRLERPVALKVMSAKLAEDPNQRKRFRTEAKAASELAHPHICVIHEVGETEDRRPFLAMEYIEGQTLDVVLQQRRLKTREILNLGIEGAGALETAHARGLMHRDTEPANLVLNQRGQTKGRDPIRVAAAQPFSISCSISCLATRARLGHAAGDEPLPRTRHLAGRRPVCNRGCVRGF